MQRDNHNMIQRKAWRNDYLSADRSPTDGRTVRVQADDIAPTVASWLAELGACSPLVELLGRAVRDGDWPATHGIADYLSVEVQVAA